jgi:hypothetical protein
VTQAQEASMIQVQVRSGAALLWGAPARTEKVTSDAPLGADSV